MAQLGSLIVNGVTRLLSKLYVNESVTAPIFIVKLQGKADSSTTADNLGTSAGGEAQPVYFKDGKPPVTKYTINTNVPANAKFTDTTYNDATTSAHGLMTAAMVTKLNGIATNANNYSHPTTAGNKHIPAGGSTGQTLKWSADGTCTWETPHRVAIAAKEPSGQLTNDEWLLEYT